jgi:hypothetical protein
VEDVADGGDDGGEAVADGAEGRLDLFVFSSTLG